MEEKIMAENEKESKEKMIHDGVSLINVPDEEDEGKAFQMLWDDLVPSSGTAQTAQGEMIWIAGRVQYEFRQWLYELGRGFSKNVRRLFEISYIGQWI